MPPLKERDRQKSHFSRFSRLFRTIEIECYLEIVVYKTKNDVVPHTLLLLLLIAHIGRSEFRREVPASRNITSNVKRWNFDDSGILQPEFGISVNFGSDCFLLRIITALHTPPPCERTQLLEKKRTMQVTKKVESVIKASITHTKITKITG